MHLLRKYKSGVRFKSFSLAEMLLSMALIAVFLTIGASILSMRGKIQGQDLPSIMCIKNELANNTGEDISAGACASKSGNPCCQAVKSCRYDQNNACPTLAQFADNGVGNETVNGKKVLGAVCDQGGTEGCKYFITRCNQDNTTCDNATNNYDLKYYLNLPENSTSASVIPVMSMAKTLYNEGSANINYWINNTNSCPVINLAYNIRGLTCTLPLAPLQIRLNIFGYGFSPVVDSNGNIYVPGYDATAQDAVIIKMNSSGNTTSPYGFIKEIAYTYPSRALSANIDSGNNVYITGITANSGAYEKLFVIRMNSSGNMTSPNGWQRLYSTGSSYNDEPDMGVLDTSNNLHITGASDFNGSPPALFYLKLDPTGAPVTQKALQSTNGSEGSYGQAIIIDSSGNVYIAGASTTNPGGLDWKSLLIKISSAGSITPPNGFAEKINFSAIATAQSTVRGIDLDSSNNIYFVGSYLNATRRDAFIFKANGSGNISGSNGFAEELDNTAHNSDFRSIIIDSGDNLYIAGAVSNGSNGDVMVIKMNTSGNMTTPFGWQKTYNSTNNYDDVGYGIGMDTQDHLFISGYSNATTSSANILVMSMSDTQISGSNIFSSMITSFLTGANSYSFSTSPNYTNTTNPFTTINTLTPTTSSPGYILN